MVMNLFVLILITFIFKEAQSFQDSLERSHTVEFILCRNCGSDISSSNYLVPIISPASRYTYNDTLFYKSVLIQSLSNGILDLYVITAAHSNCVSVGEWEETETWYPGYRWKLCVCPDCGEYIGWLFEPMTTDQQQAQSFFGLILYTLIGESNNYLYVRLTRWCGFLFVNIMFVIWFLVVCYLLFFRKGPVSLSLPYFYNHIVEGVRKKKPQIVEQFCDLAHAY